LWLVSGTASTPMSRYVRLTSTLNFFEAQHDRQSKVPELAIAGLLRPLSLCGKFLRLVPKAAMAKVLIAIVVIDAGKFVPTTARGIYLTFQQRRVTALQLHGSPRILDWRPTCSRNLAPN
jgi:hypothetical protein